MWCNRICLTKIGLFLTTPPPKKSFWALRLAVGYHKRTELLSIIYISVSARVLLTLVDEGKFGVLMTNNRNDKSSESSSGTIAGSVFGGIGGFLLICCLCNIPMYVKNALVHSNISWINYKRIGFGTTFLFKTISSGPNIELCGTQ